jgi:dimethylargininase
MLVAITRAVSRRIGACELTHLARVSIDFGIAQAQHRGYETALAQLGCRVESLPAIDSLPDSVFVEDTAVVLDELAVVTRPGAASRRPEAALIAPSLAPYRHVRWLQEPATLDGGDVLRLGRRLLVGVSGRSNQCGVEQFRAIVEPFGYTVTAVAVGGCLHLKSAITEIAAGVVLANRAWMDDAALGGVRIIDVDPEEPHAANGLLVSGRVVYPASFPRTRQRLERAGIAVVPLDVSELQKAEGAVTCCSLVFDAA